MTRFVRWTSHTSGQVRRIYIKRDSLKAKLWFEQNSRGPASFEVHYYGNDSDFTVARQPGEPIQVTEARAALADLQLDMGTCTWSDIVAKAE